MIHRFLLLSLSALSFVCMSGTMAASITYPEAPRPNPDHLITPPQENVYFYVRPDGQELVIDLDNTNNMTDFLNRHYYDKQWDGLGWSPWDTTTIVEKQARSMSLWPEYNQFGVYGVFNDFHRFWEYYSGYGPGPTYGSLK